MHGRKVSNAWKPSWIRELINREGAPQNAKNQAGIMSRRIAKQEDESGSSEGTPALG